MILSPRLHLYLKKKKEKKKETGGGMAKNIKPRAKSNFDTPLRIQFYNWRGYKNFRNVTQSVLLIS